MGQYDYALIDLNSALIKEPENADALRYRANVKLKQGKLNQAKMDIEKALQLSPLSVESALVRGQINESLRLSKGSGEDS